jgi:hypothetical protein
MPLFDTLIALTTIAPTESVIASSSGASGDISINKKAQEVDHDLKPHHVNPRIGSSGSAGKGIISGEAKGCIASGLTWVDGYRMASGKWHHGHCALHAPRSYQGPKSNRYIEAKTNTYKDNLDTFKAQKKAAHI